MESHVKRGLQYSLKMSGSDLVYNPVSLQVEFIGFECERYCKEFLLQKYVDMFLEMHQFPVRMLPCANTQLILQ